MMLFAHACPEAQPCEARAALGSIKLSVMSDSNSHFFVVRYGFCSLLRLLRMLFSTVFLFALWMSRPDSVPVGVQ
jgi:hypothetical protein